MRPTHSFGPGRFLAVVGGVVLWALSTWSHTLPISYLTVVPDKEYVHLELMLNPFELNFFSELERNRNGSLAPIELTGREEPVARKLVNCLKLRVNGRLVAPEVAGVTTDIDSHHLTLRAHYRVDARRSPLTIQCRLASITSGSHFTQVTYSSPGGRQFANLDQQTTSVTFASDAAPIPSGTSSRNRLPAFSGPAPWFALSVAVSAIAACGLFIPKWKLFHRAHQ